MKNTCQVSIAGVTLRFGTDYEPAYVEALAQRINNTLAQMLSQAPACSKLQAALLCLLDQFDQREKATMELAALHKQIETDRLDLEILRIENEKLAGKKSRQRTEADIYRRCWRLQVRRQHWMRRLRGEQTRYISVHKHLMPAWLPEILQMRN